VALISPERVVEGTIVSFFVPAPLKPAYLGFRIITGFIGGRIEAHYRREIRRSGMRSVIGMTEAWGKGIQSSIPRISGTVHDGASPVLRQFRRDLNGLVAQFSVDAAERLVLPTAKRRAPGSIGSSLVVRGGRRPYLTTSRRGTKRQVVGLLEFGGTVRAPIVPKRAKALKVGPGIYRASVTGPRVYKAQRFMRSAAEDRVQEFGEEIAGRLAGELQRRLDGRGRSMGIRGTLRF